ncbi:MAG: DUF58 domain-containing protein [Nanoarchaeota archaeon]
MPLKELRVDLAPGFKRIDIKGRRDILSRILEGHFVTLFKGKGMEFTGYRSYSYGDDASLIDWPASLRSRETLVKEFETYRNLSVYILLDVSNSMLFTSTRANKLKVEYAAELASSLAWAVLRTNNSVGMSMFNDHLVNRIYPDIGQGMIRRINKDLSDPQKYGGNFDLRRALQELRAFYKDKAVLIIISDFLGMNEGWERYLTGLHDQFELLGIMIRDPRDNTLPHMYGQVRVQDPYSDDVMLVDIHQYREEYAKTVEEEEKRLRNAFGVSKYSFLSIMTTDDFNEKIMNFFRRRASIRG